ncbi:hypothetical protein B0H19DRAFT_1067492 [Mycena capillaripes]|nr:hypothetical protein B0H19DRAFT_1067492 [Mycena capillaripes]
MANTTGISGMTSPFIQGRGPEAPIQGQVVFAPDARKILRKMELDRMARNNRRVERRAAAEEGVSEDEGDELRPFLMEAPSGEDPAPIIGQVIAPSSPADGTTGSKLLFDDHVAEKNSFRANDNSIPAAIIALAKNGISPPLTIFLPASFQKKFSSNVKTVKHGTGDSTKTTVIDITEFPAEATLEPAMFLTCYNTFLTLIESTCGAWIFQSFAIHYNNILADPDLRAWFPAYREFDRKIRAQFFTSPYIIDIQDPEYRSALQSAKNLLLLSNHASEGPSQPKGPSVGSQHTKERQEHQKPYDREDGHRYRNILCFRCGRTGHGANLCKETNPSKHGRDFVISASQEGLFRIRDNRPVCMGFNIGKCLTAANNHPLHICSLCSDSHHGASNCTRN